MPLTMKASDLALGILLLNVLALVVALPTARKTDHYLGKSAVVDEQPQCNYRQTGILRRPFELAKLFAVEQQLAVALRLVVVAGPPFVKRDVKAPYPQLTPRKIAVRLDKRRFTQTKRFYLRPGQHYSGCPLLDYLVIERGTAVLYDYILLIHNTIRMKDEK